MKDRIVYFLDYNVSPIIIAQLGWSLRKYKIILVPVNPKDLLDQLNKNKCFLVSLVQSYSQFQLHLLFKRRFLNRALRNLDLRLFELSSFHHVKESNMQTEKNLVIKLSLPQDLEIMTKRINKEVNNFFVQSKKWPGGIRAKLPC